MSGDVTPFIRRKKEAKLGDPRDTRRPDEDVPAALRDPRDLGARGREEREGSAAMEAFQIIDADDPGSGTS